MCLGRGGRISWGKGQYLFLCGKKIGVQSLVRSWSEAVVSSLPHGLLCMPLTTEKLTLSKSAREGPFHSVDTPALPCALTVVYFP